MTIQERKTCIPRKSDFFYRLCIYSTSFESFSSGFFFQLLSFFLYIFIFRWCDVCVYFGHIFLFIFLSINLMVANISALTKPHYNIYLLSIHLSALHTVRGCARCRCSRTDIKPVETCQIYYLYCTSSCIEEHHWWVGNTVVAIVAWRQMCSMFVCVYSRIHGYIRSTSTGTFCCRTDACVTAYTLPRNEKTLFFMIWRLLSRRLQKHETILGNYFWICAKWDRLCFGTRLISSR